MPFPAPPLKWPGTNARNARCLEIVRHGMHRLFESLLKYNVPIVEGHVDSLRRPPLLSHFIRYIIVSLEED